MKSIFVHTQLEKSYLSTKNRRILIDLYNNSQHSHVGPIWAPLGLSTEPYLGCPKGDRLDLSLGSTWAPHGLAQDGPRVGPSWALTGLIAGFDWTVKRQRVFFVIFVIFLGGISPYFCTQDAMLHLKSIQRLS